MVIPFHDYCLIAFHKGEAIQVTFSFKFVCGFVNTSRSSLLITFRKYSLRHEPRMNIKRKSVALPLDRVRQRYFLQRINSENKDAT